MTAIAVGQAALADRREPRRTSFLSTSLAGGPWSVEDVSKAGTRVVAGAVVTAIGWVGSSGTAEFDRQLLWTAAGVGGTALAALGATLWLLAGFGRVRTERRAVRALLAARLDLSSFAASEDAPEADVLVATPTMGRYHRPACQLVRGKVGLAAVSEAGRQPCGICRP